MDNIYEVTLEVVDNELDTELIVDGNDISMDLNVESNDVEMFFEEGEIVVGGTKDYEELYNKPTLDGKELKGNLLLSDVGAVDEDDYITLQEIDHLFNSL